MIPQKSNFNKTICRYFCKSRVLICYKQNYINIISFLKTQYTKNVEYQNKYIYNSIRSHPKFWSFGRQISYQVKRTDIWIFNVDTDICMFENILHNFYVCFSFTNSFCKSIFKELLNYLLYFLMLQHKLMPFRKIF